MIFSIHTIFPFYYQPSKDQPLVFKMKYSTINAL
nr:MAG TPA: RNA Polymerase [Caudoviricetes sp.]